MGLDKLTALWNGIRDSLWFLPSLMTVGAAALALITIQLDVMEVLPEAPAGVWLFSGTASGARGVLSAIASGLITVTGVVFSVTIVAIQLASTQFTPRILRNFTSDRINQLVLGVFIGTFTYALLVLRVVRGEDGGVTPEMSETGAEVAQASLESFVPSLSVTVAVALALVSIGFLIYFIDHAARSVQASVIIDRVTKDTLSTIRRLLPESLGVSVEEDPDDVLPDAQATLVFADRSGYVQGMDQDALLELLTDEHFVIRMEPQVGDFLLEGAPLAAVWPAGLSQGDDLARGIRSAFILGPQRTPHHDVELGVIELVDIAVKALSPGINDPTTATLCVDRISEILLALAHREPQGRVRRRQDDGGRLIVSEPLFEALVPIGFDQIRHFGAGNPRFAVTLIHRLRDLGMLVPPDRRSIVAREAASTLRSACDRIQEESDRSWVQREGQEALSALGVGRRRS